MSSVVISSQSPVLSPLQALQVQKHTISQLEWRQKGSNLIEKISYIALVAMSSTALMVTFGLLTFTGASPWFLIGSFCAIPLIGSLAQEARKQSKLSQEKIEIETGVEKELEKIIAWTEKEAQSFFERYEIEGKTLEDLKGLEPLIARQQYYQKIADEINKRYGDYKLKKATQIPRTQEKAYDEFCSLSEDIETKAIPAAIRSAAFLTLLKNPTLKWEIPSDKHEIPNVGYWKPKSTLRRTFEMMDPHSVSDFYFFYFKKKSPHGRWRIEQYLSDPLPLARVLFDPLVNKKNHAVSDSQDPSDPLPLDDVDLPVTTNHTETSAPSDLITLYWASKKTNHA